MYKERFTIFLSNEGLYYINSLVCFYILNFLTTFKTLKFWNTPNNIFIARTRGIIRPRHFGHLRNLQISTATLEGRPGLIHQSRIHPFRSDICISCHIMHAGRFSRIWNGPTADILNYLHEKYSVQLLNVVEVRQLQLLGSSKTEMN